MICYVCGNETERASKSEKHAGEGFCTRCATNARRRIARRGREEALKACGLVKVRGALGGVYWE